jgi:hypothetical protein
MVVIMIVGVRYVTHCSLNKSLILEVRPTYLETIDKRVYALILLSWVFVSGKPFQPSLMFVGEAMSLP